MRRLTLNFRGSCHNYDCDPRLSANFFEDKDVPPQSSADFGQIERRPLAQTKELGAFVANVDLLANSRSRGHTSIG
jgi:hypothetical protein